MPLGIGELCLTKSIQEPLGQIGVLVDLQAGMLHSNWSYFEGVTLVIRFEPRGLSRRPHSPVDSLRLSLNFNARV
jgi:hypothetical protein